MRTLFITATAGLALLLGGCQTDDRCTTASNPAECRAWTDAGGDINDYLVGGMVGYMLANRGGQTVVVRDPGYHGSYRPLRRALADENRQLRMKVKRQRTELRRQQAANVRKSETIRSMRFTSSASSRSNWGGSSSRSSGSSFRSSPSSSGRR